MKQQKSSGGDTLSPTSNLISGLTLNSGMLETRTDQARAMLAEAGRERDSFAKNREAINQRLDDVANMLKQIQLEEEKLDNTHNAFDTRMEEMDKMLVHLELEKQKLVQWKQEVQNQQEINSKQTKKLEKSQAAFQKQSDMVAQLMRQQQETKSLLDTREDELKSREEALALRELAVKKGEIALVHREHALKAYEQEVQKQINAYLQNENALRERMNGVMNDAMENSLINHSSEFSTQYIPGTATQVIDPLQTTAPSGRSAYRSVE